MYMGVVSKKIRQTPSHTLIVIEKFFSTMWAHDVPFERYLSDATMVAGKCVRHYYTFNLGYVRR